MRLFLLFSLIAANLFCQNKYWTNFNTQNSGLPDNYINSINIDSLGNKWIGTSRYFARFNGKDWLVYNMYNSPLHSFSSVHPIEIDHDGIKWIGTNSGLYRFDGISWRYYNTFNSGIIENFVTAIAIDKQGVKWIGSWLGISKFDGKNWSIYDTTSNRSKMDPLDNYIEKIIVDSNNIKWFASWKGLYRYDDQNWIVFDTTNSGLPYDFVEDMTLDKRGNLWVVTARGLVKYDGKNWQKYTDLNFELRDKGFCSIACNDEGEPWLGTWDGLVRIYKNGWEVIGNFNYGFPEDFVVTALVIDNHGNKWIGTNGKGVYVFNENGLNITPAENHERKTNDYTLSQNYPNPFKHSTMINFYLPQKGTVTIKLYNLLGQEVETILESERSEGYNTINYYEYNLPSGVYFYRITAGDYSETKKLYKIK